MVSLAAAAALRRRRVLAASGLAAARILPRLVSRVLVASAEAAVAVWHLRAVLLALAELVVAAAEVPAGAPLVVLVL